MMCVIVFCLGEVFDVFYKLKFVRPWIKFMSTEQLLVVVDLIQANFGQQSPVARDILEDLLSGLQNGAPRGSVPKISTQKLLKLLDVLPRSTVVEDMLSASLASRFPPGLDGQISFAAGQSLSTVLSRPKPTHTSDLQLLPSDLITRFLEKESWTASTRGIIVILLYSNQVSLTAYMTWLNRKQWTRLHSQTFAPTLAAFLECTALAGDDLSQVNDNVLYSLLDQLFLGDSSCLIRRLECVHHILELSRDRKAQLVSILQERLWGVPIMDFAFETMFLARRLLKASGCDALTTSIVDRTLQWAVRHLSSDNTDSEDSSKALENLSG